MVCIRRALLSIAVALNAVILVWSGSAAGGESVAAPASAWSARAWKKAAPSPFARVEAPSATVDGKMYVFGGFVTGLGASNADAGDASECGS
jgi:hypothetical protein